MSDNPLIANCPKDQAMAAAYHRGVKRGMNLLAVSCSQDDLTRALTQLDELRRHVLGLMRDKDVPP